MKIICTAAFAWLSIFAAPASRGQESHRHPPPEKIGKVSFPTSCAPAVQTAFNQGVALLHSFAYSAAEKRFLDVAQADPQCAMAHWGAALSYYHQLWEPPVSPADLHRAQLEIQKAQGLTKISPRELAFIHALALFYEGAPSVPHATRALAYEKAMAEIASRNPDDPESQIFYALALLSTAAPSDRSRANQKHAANILEPLFQQYPQHPGVAHYLIHAYDNPELAAQGLPAARAYAKIAPSASHALHMPSHIFTQLGLWQDSILANTTARAAAQQQGDVGEELHAMDYLMYAYLQAGREAQAAQLLQELKRMPNLPAGDFKVSYAATAIPARYAMERRSWEAAAAIPPSPQNPPQVRAISHWSRAVGLARSGQPHAALPELAGLNQALRELRERHDNYWAAQVEIQLHEAEAWIAHASGDQEKSLSFLRSAADAEDRLDKHPVTPSAIVPARQQLGELLLELSRPGAALHEFELALTNAPRRRGILAGAARAAEMSGDSSQAHQFNEELRAMSAGPRS